MNSILWEDAVDTLAEASPAAVDLLTLLAYLAPEPFPPRLLVRHRRVLPSRLAELVEDDVSLGKLVASLTADGLLRAEDRDLLLTSELASVLRARLTTAERSEWCTAALRVLRKAFPRDCEDVRTWKACAALLPHLYVAVGLASEVDADGETAAWLRDRGAVYLLGLGEHGKALKLVLPALGEVAGGEPSVLAGTVLRTLGSVRTALDEPELARADLERALEIHQACLSPDHREIVSDRTALARALEALDEHAAALEHLNLALEVDRQRDRPDLASCNVRLMQGWTLLQMDEAADARAAFEGALTLAEQRFGAEHPAAAAARTGLAHVLQAAKDYPAARDEFARALSITERALGPNHPDVSVDRSNLGGVLHELREFTAAREQLEEALKVARRTLPEYHRTVWMRERKLAALLKSMGDLDLAHEHGLRALEISRHALGPRARRTAEDLSFIARVLEREGDHRGACDAYRETLRIVEGAEDPDPREIASGAIAVGRAARRAGDLGTARRYYAKAVAIAEKAIDVERTADAERDHLVARLGLARVASLLGGELAEALIAIGRGEQAAGIREEAGATLGELLRVELDGDEPQGLYALADACRHAGAWDGARAALDRVGTLIGGDPESSRNLGLAWHRLGRDREADPTFALAAYENAIPLLDDEPHVKGVVLHDIAAIRRDQGLHDQAIELFRTAAEHKRRAARNDRDLLTTLHALARELERQKRWDEAEASYREALDVLESLPTPERRFEGVVLHDLADVKRARDGSEAAIDLYREAAERKRSADEAADPRDLGMTLLRLGRALENVGRLDEALAAYEDRRELLERLPQPDPQTVAVALEDIGDVLRAQRKPREAAQAYEDAVASRRLGDRQPQELAATLMSLAETQLLAEQPELAGPTAQEAASLYRDAVDGNPVRFAGALAIVAESAMRTGNGQAALAPLEEAFAVVSSIDEPNPADMAAVTVMRYRALKASDHEDDAAAVREVAIRALVDAVDDGAAFESSSATAVLAGLAYEVKAWELVVSVASRGLADTDRPPEPYDPEMHERLWRYLGRARKELGDHDEALEAFGEHRRLVSSQDDYDPWKEGVIVHDIANVRLAQGEPGAAVELYREAAELKRSGEPIKSRDLITTLVALAEAALDAGQHDTAQVALRDALALTDALPKDAPKRIARIEKLLERAAAEPARESSPS